MRAALIGALIAAQMAFLPAMPAHAATTIAQWTFDGTSYTSSTIAIGPVPSAGSGSATLIGGTTASFAAGITGSCPITPTVTNNCAWNTTTYPAQGTGNLTAGIQLTVSTSGFSNINLSFNQRNSGTAANTLVVQYSTDGSNFSTAAAFTSTNTNFYTRTIDFSGVPSVNNASTINLRFVTAFLTGTNAYTGTTPGGNYNAGSGTIRFDNITISGDGAVVDVPPAVNSTTPANNASGVPLNSDVVINFSEPVNVAGNWFTISCTSSGARDTTNTVVTGGPSSFTLNPNIDFTAGESCTATVAAAGVTDLDGTPDNLAADYIFSFTAFTAPPPTCNLPFTRIYDVQGTTDTSPLSGTITSVQGVVVGDYEGSSPNLRGFNLQDAAGDGDPATSDGIFVFNFNNNSVTLGSLVSVTGQVQEFQGQTQISNLTGLEICSTGASVTPADVTLPFPTADYPERYEGMLVRFPQNLFVTEHFQLGRFGQIVASANDRLRQPTQLAAPGAPAQALQAQNNLNRIIVDDALNNQNADPIVFGRDGNFLSAANTLRGGDTFSNAVGVLTYNWAGNGASPNAYRLRPIDALSTTIANFVQFAPANPRPPAQQPVSGTLKVASINLLNFFNTFGNNCTLGAGGAATDCRGADNQAEFDRQVPKTVANITGTGTDVIGIVEIENDGYGPTSAIQTLVNALNAATAPNTYAFIDVDAQTGQVNALGNDAIKVGFVYKPASVTPVSSTAVLNTGAFGVFSTTQGLTQRSRPALAQAFQQNANNEVVVVSINHLKSKGSSCSDNIGPVGPDPDAGDGQGNCNLTRKAAAQELAAWLATNPTGSTDPDVLIIGDLNSYAKEDPITALMGAGYTNLIEQKIGTNAYSYAFDGQWGYLDHALASSSLVSQVVEVAEWHINADEPTVLDYNTNFKSAGQQSSLFAPDAFRSSDHDPVIVGLNLSTKVDVPRFILYLHWMMRDALP
jgi:predicted extracellular nuclease